jgi:uncharacterized protein (DUF1778 family)
MTLTIELTPDLERQLREAAARQGQDPATFVVAAVAEKLHVLPLPFNGHGATRLTLEEEERLLDELAALGADLPPSDPAETYSRETIYADHD